MVLGSLMISQQLGQVLLDSRLPTITANFLLLAKTTRDTWGSIAYCWLLPPTKLGRQLSTELPVTQNQRPMVYILSDYVWNLHREHCSVAHAELIILVLPCKSVGVILVNYVIDVYLDMPTTPLPTLFVRCSPRFGGQDVFPPTGETVSWLLCTGLKVPSQGVWITGRLHYSPSPAKFSQRYCWNVYSLLSTRLDVQKSGFIAGRSTVDDLHREFDRSLKVAFLGSRLSYQGRLWLSR